MKCPYCKETIDDDSLYCDQCSKELRFCPECREPKRGTECPACGSMLVSGSEFFGAGKAKAPAVQRDDAWYLAGDGMHLELKAGPFGRTSGIYPEFGKCQYVSGRHGEFSKVAGGWAVLDYGSTNGTYINGSRIAPNRAYPLKKGDELKISRFLIFTIQ